MSTILAQDSDRLSKAQAIAEAIRAHGGYRWAGLYEVDTEKTSCMESGLEWSQPTRIPNISTDKRTNLARYGRKADHQCWRRDDRSRLSDRALHNTGPKSSFQSLDGIGHRVLRTIDVESEGFRAFGPALQNELEECALALRSFWSNYVPDGS